MAMDNGRYEGASAMGASRFCGLLLFFFLSVLLTTNAIARDLDGSKGEVARGVRSPTIEFIGNKAFSSENLMEVFFEGESRWITESGSLSSNGQHGIDTLTAFYYDNGFLQVEVDEPQNASGNRAMIAIDEGPLYRFGSIAVEGQLRFPRRQVQSQLTIRSGQPFRGSRLQQGVVALADFYSDRGFAYVNIDPRTRMDSKRHLVNVTVFIKPGDEIRIDQIKISGNVTTPEKIIRAALRIHEHELYSARAIRESKARLDELGLFSDTEITTEPSAKVDEINVRVSVVEKSKRKVSTSAHRSE
jgi:outer membrane protein insertion porin family